MLNNDQPGAGTENNQPGDTTPTNEQIAELEKDAAIPTFEDEELEDMSEETRGKVKELQTFPHRSKHWRGKHKKLSEDHETYKKDNPKVEPGEEGDKDRKKDKKEQDKEAADIKERRLVNLELKDYIKENKDDFPKDIKLDEEDIDEVISLAGAKDKTPLEILQSAYFQSYLKVKAEKKSQEEATPAPGNRGDGQDAEVDFSKVTPEDIRNMDEKEFDKYKKWEKERDAKK